MQIRKILPTELEWVNVQYSLINFVLSTGSDFIAVAEINGVKAGLGRVTQVENGAAELGGIYVLPEFRGQSIASHMVEFLLKNSGFATLFCIPFSHLEVFYRRFGFLPIDQAVPIPETVAKKISRCANTYESPVMLMNRDEKIRH